MGGASCQRIPPGHPPRKSGSTAANATQPSPARARGSGDFLVFPSEFTRPRDDLPNPAGKSVTFGFDGALLNVYCTLAVRLTHSGLFSDAEMWRNAAT